MSDTNTETKQAVEQPATATTTAIEQKQQTRTPQPIAFGSDGLAIQSIEDLWRFGQFIAKSDLAPKDYKGKIENCIIAIQFGAELGFKPMQSIQNIKIVNGRPSLDGDASLALCRSKGLVQHYKKEFFGTPYNDDFGCKVTIQRFGMDVAEEVFTVADAKRAKLWSKPGPWSDYPRRMLFYRPLGFLLREQFGDVMKGFAITEELEDYPETPEAAPVVISRPKFDTEAIEASATTTEQPQSTEQVEAEDAEYTETEESDDTGEEHKSLFSELSVEERDRQIREALNNKEAK